MDKNNDIQVNKVDKWDAAPESIKKLNETISFLFDRLEVKTYNIDDPEYKELVDEVFKGLDKALDDYNELEAKHNADCGLISKLEEENRDLESKLDSVTRERNHAEYILTELIEQLKIKNDVYVNLEVCINGVYEVVDKRAADLQVDLDAAIYDLKKEEENVECLKKQITRKNAEMCNLKWERDETEKKFKILIEELMRQYDIKVTFYQKPGIDMHGLRNFGVNVDCEENRKAFNELKEALDKHKSQIDKLETKHAKATRFIARLTEALNEAGVSFHYFKFGGDGEEIFYIDSLVDRMAKKHYEEQSFRLRNTVRNYGEQIRCFKNDISELKAKIYKLEKDKECSEFRNDSLLKALNQAGIRPSFDIRANKWIIRYTDKAENAFLAADQIKRNAEKRVEAADNKIKELEKKLKSAEDGCEVYRNSYERTVDDVRKLLEFLKKYGVPVKYRNDVNTWYWDFENNSFNKAWDDTLMKDCKLIDKCRKLEKENNNLTTDNKRLSNAVNAWFDMFNDMRHKRDDLKKEYEKLKETNKSLSCPVACECENFKPKVHHSYDPLDDLPDVEHS